MKKNNFKITQWWILLIAIVLSLFGLVALYSATKEISTTNLVRQIVWLVVSLVVCVGVAFMDYEKLVKISPYLYLVIIGLLVGVLFTPEIKGAHSWYDLKYFSFQPTEIGKPIFILFTTYIILYIQKQSNRSISNFKYLFVILLLTLPTIALIVVQPDYGTAVAFFISLVCILIVAGLDKRYFIIGIPLAIALVVLAYMYVLPDHAKQRIDTFLNPGSDPLGAGYNVIQSKIAIGAGELTGMGITKGNQTQLGYLSPKTTDFIFSVISEEMRFLGSATVVILYIVFLILMLYIAKTAKSTAGTLVTAGIFGLFVYHIVENIGMTMGLLPITGVPLPFISYGGSSLLTNYICVGIVLNISSQRQKTIFIRKK